jgi:hypothetical protein
MKPDTPLPKTPILSLAGLLAAAAAMSLHVAAYAAVTTPSADLLGTALTPVGAERAGNAAGTIPPWTGGGVPADLAAERPILTIDAANAAQYAAELPEGALALFRSFPDYRMRIYPTHRGAAFPAAVTDAIRQNATRAQAGPAGISTGVANAAGGIPFPIPTNGAEIVWNHLLAFWGVAREAHVGTYIASGDGTIQQTAGYREVTDFPYYETTDPDAAGRYYFKTRRLQDAPPSAVGQAYIAWQPLDVARDRYVAWRYLPGEHRARKAPSLSYDTPDPDASGYEELDDYYLFFGGPDRYTWRIAAKRDMFIPYNNDALNRTAPRVVMGPRHVNQDLMRYERHRVWIVEGTLAPGKSHVAPRRRLMIDEDTWLAVYAEAWDDSGHLWKFSEATMMSLPQVPTTIIGGQFVYDLLQGGYVYDFALGGPGDYLRVTKPHPAATFEPDALAADQLR